MFQVELSNVITLTQRRLRTTGGGSFAWIDDLSLFHTIPSSRSVLAVSFRVCSQTNKLFQTCTLYLEFKKLGEDIEALVSIEAEIGKPDAMQSLTSALAKQLSSSSLPSYTPQLQQYFNSTSNNEAENNNNNTVPGLCYPSNISIQAFCFLIFEKLNNLSSNESNGPSLYHVAASYDWPLSIQWQGLQSILFSSTNSSSCRSNSSVEKESSNVHNKPNNSNSSSSVLTTIDVLLCILYSALGRSTQLQPVPPSFKSFQRASSSSTPTQPPKSSSSSSYPQNYSSLVNNGDNNNSLSSSIPHNSEMIRISLLETFKDLPSLSKLQYQLKRNYNHHGYMYHHNYSNQIQIQSSPSREHSVSSLSPQGICLLMWLLSSHPRLTLLYSPLSPHKADRPHRSIPSSSSSSPPPSPMLHVSSVPSTQSTSYSYNNQIQHQTQAIKNPPTLRFLVKNSDPVFEQAARDTKVETCYHGSPLENWYGILHQGLLARSGTSKQRHGAVYGWGIYLARQLDMARTYAQTRETWAGSALGSRVQIVGVFDVLLDDHKSSSSKVHSKPSVRRPNSCESHLQKRVGDIADSDPAEREREQVRIGNGRKVPEGILVVTDPSKIRLKELLVWCTCTGGDAASVALSSCDQKTPLYSPNPHPQTECVNRSNSPILTAVSPQVDLTSHINDNNTKKKKKNEITPTPGSQMRARVHPQNKAISRDRETQSESRTRIPEINSNQVQARSRSTHSDHGTRALNLDNHNSKNTVPWRRWVKRNLLVIIYVLIICFIICSRNWFLISKQLRHIMSWFLKNTMFP